MGSRRGGGWRGRFKRRWRSGGGELKWWCKAMRPQERWQATIGGSRSNWHKRQEVVAWRQWGLQEVVECVMGSRGGGIMAMRPQEEVSERQAVAPEVVA
ncbi:hypothetical protein HPP92_017945 [Vanilla planifolia]|uniref:Uncharacterized protein n=1 Tax=Vanilla planifolia TaxID=51239 RepID=A0A835QGG9_VANPL|nr:hypothetical protein HPP92_017945 [Vanilla planifolia]